MKRRHKYQSPDRLDWRDSDMPVLRYGKVNGIEGVHEISANNITEYYRTKLEQLGWQMPDWDEDETYDLRSKRSRR